MVDIHVLIIRNINAITFILCFALFLGISNITSQKVNPYQTSVITCHIEGTLSNGIELHRYSKKNYNDSTGISRHDVSSSSTHHGHEVLFSVERVVSGEQYACSITNGSSRSFKEVDISSYGMYPPKNIFRWYESFTFHHTIKRSKSVNL